MFAAITYCANYVEDQPFPICVNTILLRLADAFQGDKFSPKLEQFLNVTRLRIVKILKEKTFQNNLSVAFSSDDIVRKIMKVSHSNE